MYCDRLCRDICYYRYLRRFYSKFETHPKVCTTVLCVPVTRQWDSTTSSFHAHEWNCNSSREASFASIGNLNKKITDWLWEALIFSFMSTECILCEMTNKTDMNTDLFYLTEICKAINCQHCRKILLKWNPGNVSHSKWHTAANIICRTLHELRKSIRGFTNKALIQFIVNVFSSMQFKIKSK